MPLIYLDNSATTRPCEAAVQAMEESLRQNWYNPSALYRQAMTAEKAMTAAAETIAKQLDASAKQVIFTAGGTEADNLAIFGGMQAMRLKGDILYSAAEHAAVKNSCIAAAARFGTEAREIPLTHTGLIDLQTLEAMLSDHTSLICVMHVCNETGVIMPIREICALRDRLAPQAAIHVDGVQAFMRIPFSFRKYKVQSYALSGHKIHACKGVGALVLADGYTVREQMAGGGQQRGLRSGTENTPGIAALGAAVTAYPADGCEKMRAFKQRLCALLTEAIPSTVIVGEPPESEATAPHILNIAFPPVRAETLLHALEGEEIIVGTGSACSSKKGKRSQVLTAMGLRNEVMDGAVRISLCPGNTIGEAEQTAEAIIRQVRLLEKFARR